LQQAFQSGNNRLAFDLDYGLSGYQDQIPTRLNLGIQLARGLTEKASGPVTGHGLIELPDCKEAKASDR